MAGRGSVGWGWAGSLVLAFFTSPVFLLPQFHPRWCPVTAPLPLSCLLCVPWPYSAFPVLSALISLPRIPSSPLKTKGVRKGGRDLGKDSRCDEEGTRKKAIWTNRERSERERETGTRSQEKKMKDSEGRQRRHGYWSVLDDTILKRERETHFDG